MSEPVVDGFEMIQVKVADCQKRVVAPARIHCRLQHLRQANAVR